MVPYNLEQSWSDITLSIYTHLQQILIKLKTRHALPSNQAVFLPPITDFTTVEFLPPCRYLAIGIFPAYIIADLHDMGIRQNIKKIGVSLLKHAMTAFRTNIWIPRCTLNAERENDLVSQPGINGLTPSITTTTHLDLHKAHQYNIN